MNILFILKTLDIGGVEIVTAVLANKFVAEGHKVSIFAFANTEHSVIDRLDKRIRVCIMKRLAYNCENVRAMRAVMVEENINVVINQWGLPFVPIKVARKAAEGLDIKFISVYHNTPDMNGRLQSVDMQLTQCGNPVKRIALNIKRRLFKEITAYGMRYNYKHSDHYMVLSPSFVQKFKDFTGIKNPTKLLVQTNPVTLCNEGYTYNALSKQMEVLYVGRIDYSQKRVHRVIDSWALIEAKHPDWKLIIVGDGEEKDSLEKKAKEYGLKRVSFEGFQNPVEYYKRSSILVLTSGFEGFPLVLAEAMSFGVVPVVYASYSAVYDIVSDGENGCVVEPLEDSFNTHSFANTLSSLMQDSDKRNMMAEQAILTSERDYSVDSIYKQWLGVINQI